MIGLNQVLTFQNMPSAVKAYLSRDPDIAFNFSVTIDGAPVGDFSSVETLVKNVEVHTYKALGKNDGPYELFNGTTNGRVVLKWGLMNRQTLWDWMEAVKVGKSFRRSVLVMQMTRGKIPIRVYNFQNAFPVRWTGANLNAGTSDPAIEELELSYSKLDVTAVPLPF